MAWYSASFTSGHTKNIKGLLWTLWSNPVFETFDSKRGPDTVHWLISKSRSLSLRSMSYGPMVNKAGSEFGWELAGSSGISLLLSLSLSLSPALPITPLPIMCYHVLSVLEEHETFSMITCWIANSCNSGGEKYWKNCGVRHTMAKSPLPGSNPASSCIHASFSKVARTQPHEYLSRWNRMNMMKGYIYMYYIYIYVLL